MADLIDKQSVVDIVMCYCSDDDGSCSKANVDIRELLDEIENLPEIEYVPVRHGRWIEKPPYEDETVKGLEFQIVCSECDEQNAEIIFDENSVPIGKTFDRSWYCPWCGAKMDGGAENGKTD